MPDRRALVIGINHYKIPGSDLESAVADAEAIAEQLSKHQDGKPDYECRVLLDRMENGTPITRAEMREAISDLFCDFHGDVLLYFSGHGVITDTGGYLCTFDVEPNDWGVPMDEVMTLAYNSQARDILLILDCCYSGSIANPQVLNTGRGRDPLAVIRENMTIIAASRATQASVEAGGHGLFTAAVLDALDGGAADHMGWVTAPSLYAYVERRFGAWGQHPIYKSHTTGVTVVRECAPLIDRLQLRKLVDLFPTQAHQYPLDPEHEPEDEHGNMHQPVNEEKVAIAQLLKQFRDAGLIKASIPGEQLFWTARRGHAVELTPRGREYWWLVSNNKI